MLRTLGISLLFLAGALAVAILIGGTLLGLPSSDLPDVALLLAGAGDGVGLVALVVVRPAVLGRLGGVRAQLVGADLIGSLLLGMMLAGSRAMFISGHDFAIVLTMLLFAAVLSVGFSLLCAAPMVDRIERVRRGAARLKEGELGSEIPVEGWDEIADLARDFNRMARSLEEAAEHEREMEGGPQGPHRRRLARPAHAARLYPGPDRSPRRRHSRRLRNGGPLPELRQQGAGAPEPSGRRPLRASPHRRRGARA